MALPFTDHPGRRERQLLRRHDNPLFAWPPWQVEPEQLLDAQRADHEELTAFLSSFQQVIERAANLPSDAGSEQVLGLKEDLERHYEQACGLPGDQSQPKAALLRLIEVIMQVLRSHREHDPIARQELADEAQARALHFRLLEHPLVVDLLDPDTPIGSHELLPMLLSSPITEVTAAAEIFEANQLGFLVRQGETLLARLREQGLTSVVASQGLGVLRTRLEQYDPAETWVSSGP